MKIATLLLVAAGMALASIPASAFDGFKDFKRDHWDFRSSGQYYRTESNFNQSGSQESLPSGNYFQEFNFDFGTRYFVGKAASIFLSASMNAAESHDAAATRTNSSITQILAGGDWLAYSESFDVIPEVSAVLPIDKNTPGADAVLNGEGVVEFRPKIQLQKQFSRFGGYAYGGFTYRDKGRSFLLPWGVGAFLRFSNSRLGAEIYGYQSVTDDTDTKNRAARTAALTLTNASSYRYASVNPSLTDTNFFYHMGLRGNWSFEVDGGIAVLGMNAASGYHVGALIRYSFDLTRGYVPEAPYRAPVERDDDAPRGRSQMYDSEPTLSNGRDVKDFQEDTGDGVDQRMFRSRALTPKPKIKPKRRTRPADDSLQQQLDSTEMQIELKSLKRRKKRR